MATTSRPLTGVHQLPNGRWVNGQRLLSFGVHLKHLDRQGPVHIFDDASYGGRSVCGLADRSSSMMVVQTVFPSHHPVCRHCNYSGRFGIYGGTLRPSRPVIIP